MPIEYHYGLFPPVEMEWERLVPLLGPASAAIASYDGKLSRMPNADVLLAPLTTQEAVLSSKIEGTQATMGEVLEFEANRDNIKFRGERKNDIFEILNYRSAIREAEHLLQSLPLSQRLLKKLHIQLLAGARGQNRAPGEYRKNANWIGPPGCTIEDASFIPISADKLTDGMDKWEKFIHAHFADKLVQLAILHLEFEALHPFLDGNGRLGRMFIPLFLWQSGIIAQPNFYISEYFENNRAVYYERMRAVSQTGNWTNWCLFFLEALKEQAENNANKADSIFDLYEEIKNALPKIISTQYSLQALDGIFKTPVFNSASYIRATGVPAPTARRILVALTNAGILKVIKPAKGSRSALYAFTALLSLAESEGRA